MKCLRPTKFGTNEVHNVCGQCMPCRINKRTEWHTKLMLEWQTWKQGAFITLTYSNEYLPEKEHFKGGSLDKKDFQKFMKRFRKYYQEKYGKNKIRYFGVGEYGERFKRAHYHILMFNVDPIWTEKIVQKAWKFGITQTDLLNQNRIKYTIGYTIKKETNIKDFPDGRVPEFSLMSKNPGMGWYALPKFAEVLKKRDLYPSRSLNGYHKWLIEKDGKELKTWNGIFKQGKNYYRFDRNCMTKLAQLVDPTLKEILEKKETLLLPRKYKVRKNRLHDQSYFDTIKFVTSEEYHGEQNKANKKKRIEKKSKSQNF